MRKREKEGKKNISGGFSRFAVLCAILITVE
jgi:hypothetical protein